MRVAMLFLWFRAVHEDPPRRRACQTYAVTIGVAQVGWVLLLMLTDSTVGKFFAWGALLLMIELAGPIIAERRNGGTHGTHHIAERYGPLTIITLGEGVIGTVASLAAVVESQGWTLDAANAAGSAKHLVWRQPAAILATALALSLYVLGCASGLGVTRESTRD
jgi:low temperature requirement protein LtrA